MPQPPDFFNNAVMIAHIMIAHRVMPGDRVLDATMGNGHDTLILAKAVGASGKVYAFDIQQQALDATRVVLEAQALRERVELVHDGHEHLDQHITHNIKLAIFNLGYLPGGDKAFATRSVTTLPAVEKALALLMSHGLVLIVLYSGHGEGKDEHEVVRSFAAGLDQKQYTVFQVDFINQANNPPVLIGIEKRKQLSAYSCFRFF